MYRVSLTESLFPAQPDGAVRDEPVGALLAAAARTRGADEYLLEGAAGGQVPRRWTCATLHDEALALAQALSTRYAAGERIAVWANNVPEWVLLEFASALAGLVLVTVNPANQARELAYVLEQSRSAGLFLVRSFRGNPMAETARTVCADRLAVREIVDLQDRAALFAHGAAPARLPAVAAADAVQVQYTSGTTGFPKGAVLTHRNLANNSRFCFERLGVRRGDVLLNLMPLFHTAGCSLVVLGGLQAEARILLPPSFDPAVALDLVASQRVTHLVGVPTMLVALLAEQARAPRDVSSVRALLAGGAMVAPELLARFEAVFGCRVSIIYGQTETSPGICQTRDDDPPNARTSTIGQPYPHTEVAIRRVGGGGVVAPNTVGEVCVRGYCVMDGYHDDPAATRAAIDADGWLHTGDLGRMDEHGYVALTGRVKDMIIRGGENLFPAEIENVLLGHPAVSDAAVVGVPDPYWGEIAVAFLRTRDGAPVSAADLVRHMRAELAAPKTPARWFVLDAFPLTGSGKVQKFALRDALLAGELAARELV